MIEMRDIIVPNDNVIYIYDELWKCNMIMEKELLPQDCIVEGNKVICNKSILLDFKDIYLGEKILIRAFEQAGLLSGKFNELECTEEALYNVVILLDSIYHTRLSNPYRFAMKLYKYLGQENCCFWKVNEKSDKEDIVKVIDDITKLDKEKDKIKSSGKNEYAYSFATKFCNHVFPELFPIYDSYVAGMLIWYRENKKYFNKLDEECFDFDNSSLGKYERFLEIYKTFRSLLKINTEITYAQMDHFLWTYAKIIEAYRNTAFPKPNSISYCKLP